MKEVETFIQTITKRAGLEALRLYGSAGVKYTKRDASDVVTEADLLAQRTIIEAVQQRYPDHGIIAEEGRTEHPDAEWIWLIDPIDGTRNFATRTPLWGVMVALARREELQYACIYLPVTDELCFAERGKGAYCNGERVQCSSTDTLTHSFGNTTASIRPEKLPLMQKILSIAETYPFSLNTAGSIAVNAVYMATGRRDWLVSPDGGLWDYAAPVLILAEAGCTVTKHDGSPWRFGETGIVAANPALHKELLAVLR